MTTIISDTSLARIFAVVDDEFAAPEDNDVAFQIALDAFGALGSTDPEVRDDSAFMLLAEWIDAGVLSDDQVRDLLVRATGPSGIGWHLGESDTDSVFRRTFSLLVITVILHRDNREPLLDREAWGGTMNAVLGYAQNEADLRARVDGKGWAHAIAHTADACDELLQNVAADEREAAKILAALLAMVDRAPVVFDGEEDERLALPLRVMVAQNMSISLLVAALGDVPKADAADDHTRVVRINHKLVVRSLIFRLAADDEVNEPVSDDAAELAMSALQDLQSQLAPF